MKRLNLLVVVAMVLTLVGMPQAASAAGPLYVDPLGSDLLACTAPGALACKTIQGAIGKAVANDTINVAAGIYVEAIYVNKNLSLVGAGRTVTTIQAPATLPSYAWNSGTNALVAFDTATVNISGFTIDGLGKGNGGAQFAGVQYWKSSGTISDCRITGVRDTPFGGTQDGFGIIVNHTYDVNIAQSVMILNNVIDDYQKGGIVVTERGSEATIRGNTVIGQGPTSLNAQNGINIGYAATGVIESNTVSANWYIPTDWVASGILVTGASGVQILNNTITDNEVGICLSEDEAYGYGGANNTTVTGNTLTGSDRGILVEGTIGNTGNTIAGNSITGSTTRGLDNTSPLGVVAENNWWGCAAGPGAPGCDAVSSNVDYTPWLTIDRFGLSWVKYSGNPVGVSGLCGVATPARPAVLIDGAQYKMYFSALGDGAQIYLATSTNGVSWTCGNSGSPVLPLGGPVAWDAVRVVASAVVKDGPTDYKMWYSGRSAAAAWAIGYATSPDGIVWTKQNSSNPVFTTAVDPAAWDSAIVREPSVVKVGGTYHLFYAGTALWPYFKIGHATSTDGITWTRDTANPVLTTSAGKWDAIEVYAPSVVMNGATFEMFYSGNAGGAWMTGHASSLDGKTWTKDANAILSQSGGTAWDKGDSTDYVAAVIDGSAWKLFYSGAGSGGYQIGLATLTDQPQLTFRQLGSSVGVGQSIDVYIDLTAVTNLYGYQFQVNYDTTKLSATGTFVSSFFDTSADAYIGWNATCSAGVCKFAVTKQSPATAISGSGTLARITFTGSAVGLVPLTFSSDILSDKDATSMTHSTTVGWVDVNGTATINGAVSLQGRLTPIDQGTVTAYDASGYAAPVTVNFSASTGAFSIVVPVNAETSDYTLVASHALYLSNQKTGVAVVADGTYPQATTKLLGGDAINSGKIDINDLGCIGGQFGNTPPTTGACGGLPNSPDINHDLTVNILDLVLAGGNYDLSSTQPW